MRVSLLLSVIVALVSLSHTSFAEMVAAGRVIPKKITLKREAADEARPTVEQLRKEFSAELALAGTPAPNERNVAVLHLKVSGVKRVGYCRGRTANCGLNPTCGHTGTKVDVVSYTVIGAPINDDKVAVPKTVEGPDFMSLGGSRMKKGDEVWAAYDVLRGRGGVRLLSPKKITAKGKPAEKPATDTGR
ncbi:MAG: hypothetical protein HQ567_27620 [Candidatus Nealsonbacteria bacterium]|nr:hypothetical protein [Candidatus Nealsonbacteria bacterium]